MDFFSSVAKRTRLQRQLMFGGGRNPAEDRREKERCYGSTRKPWEQQRRRKSQGKDETGVEWLGTVDCKGRKEFVDVDEERRCISLGLKNGNGKGKRILGFDGEEDERSVDLGGKDENVDGRGKEKGKVRRVEGGGCQGDDKGKGWAFDWVPEFRGGEDECSKKVEEDDRGIFEKNINLGVSKEVIEVSSCEDVNDSSQSQSGDSVADDGDSFFSSEEVEHDDASDDDDYKMGKSENSCSSDEHSSSSESGDSDSEELDTEKEDGARISRRNKDRPATSLPARINGYVKSTKKVRAVEGFGLDKEEKKETSMFFETSCELDNTGHRKDGHGQKGGSKGMASSISSQTGDKETKKESRTTLGKKGLSTMKLNSLGAWRRKNDEDENEHKHQHQREVSFDDCEKEATDDVDVNSSSAESQKSSTKGSKQKEKRKETDGHDGLTQDDYYRSTRKQVQRRRDSDVVMLLANSIWEKGKARENEVVSSEEESFEEEASEFATEQPPPLKQIFGWEKPEPPEKSEFEKEIDRLWEEMAFVLKSIEMGADSSPDMDDSEKDESTMDENPANLCRKGKHELILDIEIGLKCKYCRFVATEIRYIVPPWGKQCSEATGMKFTSAEEDPSMFNGLPFHACGMNSSSGPDYVEGTVWDVIPGIKKTMYLHQQQGFEFVWKNIAGTMLLDELKSLDASCGGGCIISHAPGTGKTRLTIVFLQAYLQLFPNCRPVIIAPASLLLTWEEEFRKWNIGVPFHNLNNLDFSRTEIDAAVEIFKRSTRGTKSKNAIRMVKLFSWSKEKSVLGVSYNLYEKLAGEKSTDQETGTTKRKEVRHDKEREEMRKILLKMPGLLVLDEGHTPRNQKSCIWKTLSKVQTQKRIILSGTPFQNNFLELCNVLYLARPEHADKISLMRNLGRRGKRSSFGASVGRIDNDGIKKLKALMAPFVHVHKGSILRKSLPGLRDCVVVLNPSGLQKKVLEGIEFSQNTFEYEHKLSVVSVHPSLISCCTLSKTEKSVIDQTLLEKLEKIKLDPSEGIKTRFLVEFIRLCEAINEKVLVFSQYIDPLSLIMDQLLSLFNWFEGKEVFYMHGKLDLKQRQMLINKFNDPQSEAKLILASTRACSEGINLVGASRVVLLDVVWNPSVERQAISRAYRIGQTRVVYTYHLVIKGTPECDKYCKQAEKDRISEMVFSTSTENGKVKSSESVAEDKVLDEMVQHANLQDMFEKLIYQPKESGLIEGFSSVIP